MNALRERFAALAAAAELRLDPAQIDQLMAYADLLRRWNRGFNLISRRDMDRLEQRHLLDALSIRPWLSGPRIADLGSGGGLPGIPLALVCPDDHFTLVERSERKARFLEQVKIDLNIPNIDIEPHDWVTLTEEFDMVISRGVGSTEALWTLVCPRLRRGGALLTMTNTSGDVSVPVVLADADRPQAHTVAIPSLGRRHGIVVVNRLEHGADTQADGT